MRRGVNGSNRNAEQMQRVRETNKVAQTDMAEFASPATMPTSTYEAQWLWLQKNSVEPLSLRLDGQCLFETKGHWTTLAGRQLK